MIFNHIETGIYGIARKLFMKIIKVYRIDTSRARVRVRAIVRALSLYL